MNNNETYNKILITVFMLFIVLFCILSFIIKDKEFSENENKVMATFPSFNTESLLDGKYTSSVEEYFSDHIIFRDTFISLKTLTEVVMGKNDNSRVYFTEDSMLIEMHNTISLDVINENLYIINKFNNTLNEKYKVNMDLMIVNTKTSIYEDKLPEYSNVNDEDKIIEYIYNNTNTNNIAISETLRSNSDEYIFFDLDHHWTQYGAYLAYLEYAKEKQYEEVEYTKLNLSNEFYGSLYSKAINPYLNPDSIDIYELNSDIKYSIKYDGAEYSSNVYEYSNIDIKDKYTVYLDGNHSIVEINTNNKNGKTMVVFKDSFAHPFIPFLVKDYEKVIVLDLRYIYTDLTTYFEENNVTDVLMLYNIYNFTNENEFVKLENY